MGDRYQSLDGISGPCGPIAGCSGTILIATAVAPRVQLTGAGSSSTWPATFNASQSGVFCVFQSPTGGIATSWPAGDWVIPLNVTTGNSNITLTAVYVCRIRSDCVSLATVGSLTGLSQVLTTGLYTWTITGSLQTANATDTFAVVLVATNGAGSSQSVTITSDQQIDTPFTTQNGWLTSQAQNPMVPFASQRWARPRSYRLPTFSDPTAIMTMPMSETPPVEAYTSFPNIPNPTGPWFNRRIQGRYEQARFNPTVEDIVVLPSTWSQAPLTPPPDGVRARLRDSHSDNSNLLEFEDISPTEPAWVAPTAQVPNLPLRTVNRSVTQEPMLIQLYTPFPIQSFHDRPGRVWSRRLPGGTVLPALEFLTPPLPATNYAPPLPRRPQRLYPQPGFYGPVLLLPAEVMVWNDVPQRPAFPRRFRIPDCGMPVLIQDPTVADQLAWFAPSPTPRRLPRLRPLEGLSAPLIQQETAAALDWWVAGQMPHLGRWRPFRPHTPGERQDPFSTQTVEKLLAWQVAWQIPSRRPALLIARPAISEPALPRPDEAQVAAWHVPWQMPVRPVRTSSRLDSGRGAAVPWQGVGSIITVRGPYFVLAGQVYVAGLIQGDLSSE